MALRDLALSKSGDLLINESGDFTIIDSVRQGIQIKLRWIKGEWVFNPEMGVPYFESILVKTPNRALIEKTLRDHREEYEGEEEIEELPDLRITLLKSGPLGGDQQLGSLIADGKIDALIFFWDPMSAQPHDVDVKALLRLATLYNVPTAINRSSADFLISSPLFEDDGYVPVVKDYKAYVERVLK